MCESEVHRVAQRPSFYFPLGSELDCHRERSEGPWESLPARSERENLSEMSSIMLRADRSGSRLLVAGQLALEDGGAELVVECSDPLSSHPTLPGNPQDTNSSNYVIHTNDSSHGMIEHIVASSSTTTYANSSPSINSYSTSSPPLSVHSRSSPLAIPGAGDGAGIMVVSNSGTSYNTERQMTPVSSDTLSSDPLSTDQLSSSPDTGTLM